MTNFATNKSEVRYKCEKDLKNIRHGTAVESFAIAILDMLINCSLVPRPFLVHPAH